MKYTVTTLHINCPSCGQQIAALHEYDRVIGPAFLPCKSCGKQARTPFTPWDKASFLQKTGMLAKQAFVGFLFIGTPLAFLTFKFCEIHEITIGNILLKSIFLTPLISMFLWIWWKIHRARRARL